MITQLISGTSMSRLSPSLPTLTPSSRLGPYESETNITGEIRIQITFEQYKVPFHFSLP